MEKQKNIPSLRFPEFSGEWETNRFGDIYNFKVTNSFSRENLNYIEGTVKNIHYGDIHTKFSSSFNIKNEYVPYINPSVSIERIKDENYCLEGDLIMADASEDYADIGKSIEVVNLNNEKLLAGLHTFLARPNLDKISIGFAGHLMKSNSIRLQIIKEAQGTKVLSLSTTRVTNVILKTPEKTEQTKIASFLTKVDEKLTALKKKKELLEQYKKGVMQQIFSQELRFKDDDGNDFPDWEEKKLGEVARITTGSSNRVDSNLDGDYTFFDRSQDIRSSNRFLFDTEAIIVPGEGQEFIPKYFIGKFDLHQRTYAIMDFENQNGKFLYYSISFNSNHLNSHAVGSTVKSLRLPMFEKMPINLPCQKEQAKIANFLNAIDVKITHCQSQLTSTELWKKGLLQNMFV